LRRIVMNRLRAGHKSDSLGLIRQLESEKATSDITHYNCLVLFSPSLVVSLNHNFVKLS